MTQHSNWIRARTQAGALLIPGRRRFLRLSTGLGVGVAGSALLAACGGSSSGSSSSNDNSNDETELTDADILNFALNLEYLEAEFYLAAIGGTLAGTDGEGTEGTVTGGREVDFSGEPAIREYAREIADDERKHVEFLRRELGDARVARPDIDISATGPFSAAAQAAGVVGPGDTFDPYESPDNFLLGAYLFEDVGVTAYKGASPLIESDVFLEAAAGILAVEAYHAGLIRGTLFARGLEAPALHETANDISAARDSLTSVDGDDQGITADGTTGSEATGNIVPTDDDAIVFSRTPGDVLNIVYLDGGEATEGGFFPSGVNGTLSTSSG